MIFFFHFRFLFVRIRGSPIGTSMSWSWVIDRFVTGEPRNECASENPLGKSAREPPPFE
jgi:hypothetical protein